MIILLINIPLDAEKYRLAQGLLSQLNQLCHEYNLASYEASIAAKKLREEGQERKPFLVKKMDDVWEEFGRLIGCSKGE